MLTIFLIYADGQTGTLEIPDTVLLHDLAAYREAISAEILSYRPSTSN